MRSLGEGHWQQIAAQDKPGGVRENRLWAMHKAVENIDTSEMKQEQVIREETCSEILIQECDQSVIRNFKY